MPDARIEENGRIKFDIGPLLGAGTFGEVYLARMTSVNGIEQEVAVKLLNPGLSPRSQPVSRMRDEGMMLAALNHPAILHVMDFCYLDGRIGLVTEFVPGADLHDCIFGHDPIPPRAALEVIGLMADALDAAYSTPTSDGARLNLVHRDIKPANVRITPHGTVKVLDFGIAKSEDARRETETTERMAIGTPSYMAPEVQTYEVLDALPSRDVFALGCTLYEALVRELYFEGLDPKEIVRRCNREERFAEWRSMRMPLVARFGAPTADLVGRMVAYEHTLRPSAREVADSCLSLAEMVGGETLRSWCRRRPWPDPKKKEGPWSGLSMTDQGMATRTGPVSRAAGATLAPMLDDRRPSTADTQGQTIIAPDARSPTATTVASGASQITVRSADGATQVVVVTGGNTDSTYDDTPRRRRRSLGDMVATMLMGGTLTLVLAGGFVLWDNPDVFTAALRGETDVVLGYLSSKLPGDMSLSMPALGGQDYEVAESGTIWGARSNDPELGVLVLQGDQQVLVSRAGKPSLMIFQAADLQLPPGPVSIATRGDENAPFVAAYEVDIVAGGQARVNCSTSGCYRF
ncbi:MAG: serine/threonine protein kinase [Alphaproteobacteria bacterium]|nr:serine/threonine protein kinase [Alphaproteobacteria bacterium]